jgi:DNA-binding transcriptional MerR regulator
MSKSPDAFRTISEVADWLGIQAHVLRFWESKFNQIKPVKRAGGRRYYRPSDMELLGGIKKLLHDDGMTIKGVQKMLREHGVAHVSEFSQPLDQSVLTIEGTASEAKLKSTVVSFPPKTSETASTPEMEPNSSLKQRAILSDPPSDHDGLQQETQEALDSEFSGVQSDRSPALDSVSDATQSPDAQVGEDQSIDPTIPTMSDPNHGVETPGTDALQAPEPNRPRVIDIADPPEDSQVQATPGVLSALFSVNNVSAELAEEIAPVVRELADWLDAQKNRAAG